MTTIRSATMLSLLLLCLPAFGCMAMDEAPEDDEIGQGAALSCQAPIVEVIVKGRENRFGLDGQQVALDPGIPMERICNNRVASACKSTCFAARARAQASGVRGFQDSDPVRLRAMGVVADEFNAALGNLTNFSALGDAAGGGAGGGAGGAEPACNAKLLEVLIKGKEHRFGFDGRQVALNPAIPIDNICQRVAATCQARCATAKAAAIATGIKGFSGNPDPVKLRQMGTLADSFNKALGNPSNFESGPINLN
jgi:hypothetical protein